MTWQARAECRDLDPAAFEHGDASAAAACARCPVRRECFTEAMTPMTRCEYPIGYWAGTTENRRAELRRSGWKPGDPLPEPRAASGAREARFAAESFAYAQANGAVEAAEHYGVHTMRLYRAWDAYGLGRPGRPARPGENVRAAESFAYARQHGTLAAAARYGGGAGATGLYRLWDRWRLGRPGLASRRAS